MKSLVLGLGVSGKSALELLRVQGKEAIGFDDQLASKNEREVDFSFIDQVIVSPGVAPTHPFYQRALSLGIEVIGEMEYALRHVHQPCIGITGTNGKTTVSLLVQHLLSYANIPARALGNIGSPLTAYCVAPDPREVLVIELSSFQLETMTTSAFDVGIILNITPDHLDRHGTMEIYAGAKCRLQQCLKKDAKLFIHSDAKHAYKHLLRNGHLEIYNQSSLPDLGNIPFPHDKDNVLAAWAVIEKFGVTLAQLNEGLKRFKKPEHRIEFIAEVQGVRYYNDSKGTNINAVICAVNAMPSSTLLIAGGVDKGGSYREWKQPFAQKVKKLIVFGEAASKIENELMEAFLVERVASLEAAVDSAAMSAQLGDCVLLSPGCASYDMFRNYAHRGEEFKRYVYERREKT